MDLNLNLGPPLCPPPTPSIDLGYDLALNDLPFQSSEIDDVLMRIPFVDALNPFDEIPDPENLFESFGLPPYNDIHPTPYEERTDDNAFNSVPYSASPILDNDPLARAAGSALQRELLEYPERWFRTLLESGQWSEMGGARSDREDSGGGTRLATDPDRLMRDIRRSGRLVGSVGKHKANDKGLLAETLPEENEEKNGGASDFDCNICFEVANEPVVTCCGHLFCWPCLYRWLHVHCIYKECPVCEGRVNESNVVPIYGRGGSEASGGRKDEVDRGLKIPPRPRGSRVESHRQHLPGHLLRSEAWIIQEMQHLFNELPETFWFLRREEARDPPTSPRNVPSTSPLQTAMASHRQDILQSSVPPEPRSTTRRREQHVTVTSSDDLPDPGPSHSQASASSTMAMIQGDVGVPDSSLEHERGSTSMVIRRRTRSQSIGSSGADEQVPRQRHRRGMN